MAKSQKSSAVMGAASRAIHSEVQISSTVTEAAERVIHSPSSNVRWPRQKRHDHAQHEPTPLGETTIEPNEGLRSITSTIIQIYRNPRDGNEEAMQYENDRIPPTTDSSDVTASIITGNSTLRRTKSAASSAALFPSDPAPEPHPPEPYPHHHAL